METKQIKDLEYLKRLTEGYLNTLKLTDDKTNLYTAEIKLRNYCELSGVIINMLKLCVLGLDDDAQKNSAIDINLILEMVLQLFPVEEFELLSEIHTILNVGSNNNENK